MAPAKILVIDDEPQVTEIVEAFLKNAGHEVFAENEAHAGLQKARQLKPDIILLDIMTVSYTHLTLPTN